MMGKKALHALRLRFPGEFELKFREDYYYKSLNSLRLSLLLGAVIYGLFGVLDVMISPETRPAIWVIRYGIVCPAILACLLFSFSRRFKRYMQPAVFFTVVIGGVAIIAMMVIVGSPINYFHNAGLVLVLMYAFTFSKLRFSYTCAASWLIVLVYEVIAVRVMRTPLSAFLNDNFLFVSAIAIGMFSVYYRERYIRRDFLNNQLVREIEENRHLLEREKILRDLHDGLGGIITNIRLLADLAKNADAKDIKKTLMTISELSQEGLAEIKGFMQSLDGREITWQALAAEIRMRGSTIVEPHGFTFTIKTSMENPADPPRSLLWLNLLRIYKEALTNVVKHSGGKKVDVDLNITVSRVSLLVQDNGTGITKSAAGGRGLTNMRKRAEEIGGLLTVGSGSGTKVRVEVPLPVRYETRENEQGPPEVSPGIKAEDRRKGPSEEKALGRN